METKSLKARWMALFPFVQNKLLEEGFVKLVGHYNQKHRCYHTLEHISACLKLFDDVGALVHDRFSVEVALWFHDVTCNPKRNDNESMSARYALNFLTAIDLDEDTISKIVHFIKLTKHPSKPKTNDECFLIDIDLSILGEDQEIYDRYEKCIRKEYCHVPTFLYKHGRKKLLNSFLVSDSIYSTKYFQDKCEIRARENIFRALKQL